jgi:hypothetical protein
VIAEEDADGIEDRVAHLATHLATRPTILVADDTGLRRILAPADGRDPPALPRGDALPAPNDGRQRS